jgi:hypothetical protein
VFRVPNIVTVFSDSVLKKYYMKKGCYTTMSHTNTTFRVLCALRGRFGAKSRLKI